jgi:hypothetical protein
MSDEPKNLDPLYSPWQSVAVACLDEKPKPEPARSVGNAIGDIGGSTVLMAAMWGAPWLLGRRDWATALSLAAFGGICGLALGIHSWLKRPARMASS